MSDRRVMRLEKGAVAVEILEGDLEAFGYLADILLSLTVTRGIDVHDLLEQRAEEQVKEIARQRLGLPSKILVDAMRGGRKLPRG